MAYPMLRSMNAEMNEGSTDGKYKKAINNRGGVVDSATYEDRRELSDVWYGIHEISNKIRPDGEHVYTPYTRASRAEGSLGFVA